MSPNSRNRSSRNRQTAGSMPVSGEPVHAPIAGGPMDRIGDVLKRERERRGDDLQQIAHYLCIRRGFLVALEESRYDELPADAYVIGFLRTYANYLGLDGRQAIERYRGEMSGRRRKPALVLPTPIAEGRTPSGAVMIGALIVAVMIYGLWYGFSSSDRAVVSAPPPLPTTTVAVTPPATPVTDNGNSTPIALPNAGPVTTAPGGISIAAIPPEAISNAQHAPEAPAGEVVPPAPSPAEANPAPPPNRLSVRAEKESWVLVADGKGHAIFDQVMKPGDVYPVPALDGLKLTTGNSSGITLVLDGADLPKLSRDSRILHDLPLDPEKLRHRVSEARQ